MKKESGVFVVVLVAFFGVVFGVRCRVDTVGPAPVVTEPVTPEIEIKPTPAVVPQPNVKDMANDELLAELRKRSGKPSDAETRAMLQEALRRGILREVKP